MPSRPLNSDGHLATATPDPTTGAAPETHSFTAVAVADPSRRRWNLNGYDRHVEDEERTDKSYNSAQLFVNETTTLHFANGKRQKLLKTFNTPWSVGIVATQNLHYQRHIRRKASPGQVAIGRAFLSRQERSPALCPGRLGIPAASALWI